MKKLFIAILTAVLLLLAGCVAPAPTDPETPPEPAWDHQTVSFDFPVCVYASPASHHLAHTSFPAEITVPASWVYNVGCSRFDEARAESGKHTECIAALTSDEELQPEDFISDPNKLLEQKQVTLLEQEALLLIYIHVPMGKEVGYDINRPNYWFYYYIPVQPGGELGEQTVWLSMPFFVHYEEDWDTVMAFHAEVINSLRW